MPDKVDLAYAIGLPPAEAIAYFQSKGYAISFKWQDVWQEAHARAFTVAGVLKMDVLQDIREALAKALNEGTTLQTFVNDLAPLLEKKGWYGRGMIVDQDTGEITGKRLGPRRLQTIFETNMQSSYMAGRYQWMAENAEDGDGWEYVAVMDSRTRPAHRAMHGRLFRFSDPATNFFWPPNGFRCRCRARMRRAADIDAQGLRFTSTEGHLYDVEVPAGKDRTATVKAFKAPGMERAFAPDAGFSFNPGRQAWKPDLSQYPPQLVQQFSAEQRRGK